LTAARASRDGKAEAGAAGAAARPEAAAQPAAPTHSTAASAARAPTHPRSTALACCALYMLIAASLRAPLVALDIRSSLFTSALTVMDGNYLRSSASAMLARSTIIPFAVPPA